MAKDTYRQWLYENKENIAPNLLLHAILSKTTKTQANIPVGLHEGRFITEASPAVVMFDKQNPKDVRFGFKMDNYKIYERFLNVFFMQKPQNFKDTLLFIDKFQKILLGEAASDELWQNGYDEFALFNEKEKELNMYIMPINEIIRLKISHCSERSALVHNLLKILGFDTVRTECFLTDKKKSGTLGEYHALNIIKIPDVINNQGKSARTKQSFAVIFDVSIRLDNKPTIMTISQNEYKKYFGKKSQLNYTSHDCIINKDK